MTPRKKKILYIITKSNFGGAQRYVFDLVTNLPRDEFEVLVAFGGHGLLEKKLREAHVRTVTIESFERDIDLLKEVRSMTELSRLMMRERPDIVHLNSSKAGGSGAFVARMLRVPNIIFTAHGWPFFEERNAVWRALAWFFSWLTALFAHKVIVVSKHDHEHGSMPFLRKKVHVIHPSISKIDFKDREKAREALIPLRVSGAHERDRWAVITSEHNHNKNIAAAIEGVQRYNMTSTERIFLVITGEGELRPDLETFVQAENMTGSVFFTGYVDEVRLYLRAFDIFLLPSLKEGLPYSLLEAGAAGLYCIASNVGGIPEVIEDGVNGRLIDPHNPDTIRDALETYGQTPSLREKIETSFNMDEMIRKTTALYR